MDFLQLLESKPFIESWKVLNHRTWQAGFYYKIRIHLTDDSLLQASEYKDIEERNYSFHWQDNEGNLIIRWDNAPHFKELSTFPHHKHLPDRVEEHAEMFLEEVLSEIEKILVK
ncbi:MAG: DUF6516 family protein [Bacteroidota bacterium]